MGLETALLHSAGEAGVISTTRHRYLRTLEMGLSVVV
jgi:hypothetical protein